MELIHAIFDAETIGRWTEVTKFAVDADKRRRYALATNDTNPCHLSGEIAPPVFPVVATVPHVQRVLEAGLPPDVLALNRSVHGEQDNYYHRTMRPGRRARCASTSRWHPPAFERHCVRDSD